MSKPTDNIPCRLSQKEIIAALETIVAETLASENPEVAITAGSESVTLSGSNAQSFGSGIRYALMALDLR